MTLDLLHQSLFARTPNARGFGPLLAFSRLRRFELAALAGQFVDVGLQRRHAGLQLLRLLGGVFSGRGERGFKIGNAQRLTSGRATFALMGLLALHQLGLQMFDALDRGLQPRREGRLGLREAAVQVLQRLHIATGLWLLAHDGHRRLVGSAMDSPVTPGMPQTGTEPGRWRGVRLASCNSSSISVRPNPSSRSS